MSENTQPQSNPNWNITGLMEAAGAALRRGFRRWQARRTAATLYNLGDDVLRDIGITRAEIPAVALKVTAPAAPASARRRPSSYPATGKEVTT